MDRYLTRAQTHTAYPEPAIVTGMLLAHGHHPRLNLHHRDYRRPWQLAPDALCAETDPDAFFPDKGGTTEPGKYVCRRCDVREDCLLWAIQARERHGIWGGISERDRRTLARAADRPTFNHHHDPDDTDDDPDDLANDSEGAEDDQGGYFDDLREAA